MLKRIFVHTYAMSSCMRPTDMGLQRTQKEKKFPQTPLYLNVFGQREGGGGMQGANYCVLCVKGDKELLSPDTYISM